MRKATAPQKSASLTALSQEIERKLQKVLNSSSPQRLQLLQQLFADIALEIDDRAQEIILSRGEDEITESRLCFYDVLANHFVIKPENGQRILDLIVLLWSQSFASNIFTLLFHKWLFEVPVENPEALLRYGSALVQGAINVFWIDIQTNTRSFLSLFRYLLEDVALVPTRLEKISLQLQKLKVEPVLLHYLSSLRALQGIELRMTTSTRLKACLYSFTSPGGPMYPTRAVRHAAWASLDLLFPVGQYPRHVISLFFRLLYPWYWPSSCWNFIKVCITTIFYSLLRLLFSSWERMKKIKE